MKEEQTKEDTVEVNEISYQIVDEKTDKESESTNVESVITVKGDEKPEEEIIIPPIEESFFSKLDYIDKKYSLYIHKLEVGKWTEIFIYLFSRAYNPEFVVIYFIIMLLHSSLKYKDYYFIVKPLLHVVVGLIFTGVLKKLINRPRPVLNEQIKRRFNCRSRETNGSMPSGDALQAATFSVILIDYYGFFGGLLTVPLVMFSRIFYFCHYICDTLAGAFLGLILSSIMYHILKNF